MWKLLFALILFAASGCSLSDFLLGTSNTRVTTETFDGVIFAADNAEQQGLGYEFNETIIDYWTPTEADIITLESGLESFLQSELAPDAYGYEILDDLTRYKRQYFGIRFEGGEPLIYANYFCDFFDEWLESYVWVMDGGDCFFQLLYDPATGIYSNLRINGVA